MRILISALVAIMLCTAAHADKRNIVKSLDWKNGVGFLPLSHATIRAPSEFVVGDDAIKLAHVINGPKWRTGSLEAVLMDDQTGEIVYFEFMDDGYVSIDDWNNIDADAFLKEVHDNTELSNEDRKAAGVSAMHVTGWARRPTLDRDSNTVSWSIAATDEQDGPMLNTNVLMFNRNGYERLIWAGDRTSKAALLDQIRDGFFFAQGETYKDHLPTDKIAAYGVAGLVATILGVKAAKVGGAVAVGGLALLAKKAGALLILPFVFAWGFVKRMVSRLFGKRQIVTTPVRREPPPVMTPSPKERTHV